MSGVSTAFRSQQHGHAGIVDGGRGDRGVLVRLASNMDKEEITGGGTRLTQFVSEPPQSIDFVVDSRDKINGSSFDFTVNMQSNLFRARTASVSRAIIPKMFNVTSKNNVIEWRYDVRPDLVTPQMRKLTSTLIPGFYDTARLCSEMMYHMNRSLKIDIIDNVPTLSPASSNLTCVFDAETNTFKTNLIITQSLPIVTQYNAHHYYLEGCSFIARGKNLAPFPGYPDFGPTALPWPAGTSPTLPLGSQYPYNLTNGENQLRNFIMHSGVAGMVYTRYITLHSKAVNQFSYGETRTSKVGFQSNVIAVFDVANVQVDPNRFLGTYIPSAEPDAPILSIINPQKQFQKFLDFQVRDEYGFLLDEIFQGPVSGALSYEVDPKFPSAQTLDVDPNTLGITFWLNITF